MTEQLLNAQIAASEVILPDGFHVMLTDNEVEPFNIADTDPGLAINTTFALPVGDSTVVTGRLTIIDWHNVDGNAVIDTINESIRMITEELGNLQP